MLGNNVGDVARERVKCAEKMFERANKMFDDCDDGSDALCAAIELNRRATDEFRSALNTFIFLSELKDAD